MPSTRRAFVVAAAAGLGGCTSVLSDDAASEGSPVDGTDPGTGTPDDCTAGYYVDRYPFTPVEDLPATLDRAVEREVVAAAVADGETTYETYGQEPLDEGVVAHEDTYYWLSITAASATEVPAYLFDCSWEYGREAPADATVIAYADLPESDREAMQLLVAPEGSEEGERHPSESLTIRERPVPYPEGGDDSELLARDTVWVRWNDREYRVSTGERTSTERHTYRYAAEQVADDDAGLRAWAGEEFVVDLSLSEAARDAYERAGGEAGYEACEPAPDGLDALLDQLPEDARLPGPADGWYVRVDGERSRLTVMQWVE
ncbi:hypothetical protein [Halorarius halobius]|uniref:hypothetical protein n=1 Tax=Halorarius halobius TaxID=2962671 RepID=UPI0020CDA4F9|nr:hypothetical protein [Halorarius halobius]